MTVVFSEAMKTDGSADPTLTFEPNVGGGEDTLNFASGQWTSNTTYTATYNVADTNDTVANVTIGVTGARDAAGNAQQTYTPQAEFSIDTANPTVPETPTIVSTDSEFLLGNSTSLQPSSSADGHYVAFLSYATNLVPDDNNDVGDVFVKDMVTGVTTRVSTDVFGAEGNADSFHPSISADGRFVAFESLANNLVPDDTNNTYDVFVKDMQSESGMITRVSTTDSSNGQADSASFYPSISGDGNLVVFQSSATNLVSGDTNETYDVFVKNLTTGETIPVSTGGNGFSAAPSISPDGGFVSFYSSANNLVPGDMNNRVDVFMKDLATGAITLVSTDSSGTTQGDQGSGLSAISQGGQYVAFLSFADNLVPGDTNGVSDVFLKNTSTGELMLVSSDWAGTEGNFASGTTFVSISSDGRYVTFDSLANNLVPGDTNGVSDVFVKDMVTENIVRISTDGNGVEGNLGSAGSSISADGVYVAFDSSSSNLVPNDNNESTDVFRVVNPLVPTIPPNAPVIESFERDSPFRRSPNVLHRPYAEDRG